MDMRTGQVRHINMKLIVGPGAMSSEGVKGGGGRIPIPSGPVTAQLTRSSSAKGPCSEGAAKKRWSSLVMTTISYKGFTGGVNANIGSGPRRKRNVMNSYEKSGIRG